MGGLVGVASAWFSWLPHPVLYRGCCPLVGRAWSHGYWLWGPRGFQGWCFVIGGQSLVLEWLVAGPGVPDLVSTCWCVGLFPETLAAVYRVSQSLCWPADEWGWIPGAAG